MSEEPAMLPAALDDEATGMAPAAPPALARLQGSTEADGDQAGAAAEATPTQEEPGRLPAQERRTWFFRGMIALLGVLIAGLLAGGVVELRRGGVSVLATAIVIGFCAILGGGRLWLMALGYGWKEERGLKPGTPIPAKAKKSRWWRIGLVYWAIFNALRPSRRSPMPSPATGPTSPASAWARFCRGSGSPSPPQAASPPAIFASEP
jgi:hypothetical protein